MLDNEEFQTNAFFFFKVKKKLLIGYCSFIFKKNLNTIEARK